jgi:hypothetical protein
MRHVTPAFWRFLPVVALGVALSRCASPGVNAVDPGFSALLAKDYATARDDFLPEQARYPHDPYLQLDLGLAYQGLGQMDLAEPLYRQAMIDGKNAIPVTTTNPDDAGKTIATIACENLKVGLSAPTAC